MEEEKSDQQELSVMFEYHVKNLVEFTDKYNIPQQKIHMEKLNDIVLYIQDESDFYQAWENVFRGEVQDYLNEDDGERYKASQTSWIQSLPEILSFQMQRTEFS